MAIVDYISISDAVLLKEIKGEVAGDILISSAIYFDNISNLKITRRTAEFFDFVVDVEVEDVQHLTDIMAALRAMPCISNVERARI